MKKATSENYQEINLSEKYRPIALCAVKAAVSIAQTRSQPQPRKNSLEHLLLPEDLPEA
ncbi:hypothetical protein NKJ40_27740 [Mesorhizobium sp. M0119]|uniref:hypothetical protein n=1 Tax=Mesorhizobium sp. M0119 TaxID=2956885 RepID=UPI00333BEAEC